MARKRAAKKAGKVRASSTLASATEKGTVKSAAGKVSESGARWTFLTNHSHVLILLDSEEPPVLRDVALRVGITERAVQRIVQDLEEGGFVERQRVGRRNRYRVMRDRNLRHAIESHRTIGDLLDLVASDS